MTGMIGIWIEVPGRIYSHLCLAFLGGKICQNLEESFEFADIPHDCVHWTKIHRGETYEWGLHVNALP